MTTLPSQAAGRKLQISTPSPALKLAGLLVLALLTACSSTPRADARFGDAVRIAKAQQTMHPEASKNMDQVKGMDGRAAREAIDRYHKSFKEPQQHQSVFTIGIGSGT